MTIRRLFSARSARPKLERTLEAIVRVAVYVGVCDGTFDEVEVDGLVDAVRGVATQAVGEALAEEVASVPVLLDLARASIRHFMARGEDAYLADIAQAVEGDFKRDALLVAHRVISADHVITVEEEAAFRSVVVALGFEGEQAEALTAMAKASSEAAPRGPDAAGIALVRQLLSRGWTDPFADLKSAGIEVRWYDVALQFIPARVPRKTLLRLDLDGQERALHLHVTDEADVGPHLIIYYGGQLPEVVRLLDAAKDELCLDTLEAHLARVWAVCPDVFVERDGGLFKLGPPPDRVG